MTRPTPPRTRWLSPVACAVVMSASAYDLFRMQLTLLAIGLLAYWWLLPGRSAPRSLTLLVCFTSPLLTVPLASAGRTGVAYLSGSARLPMLLGGDPGPEASNLDPTHRLFPQYLACAPPCFGPAALVKVRGATLGILVLTLGPPSNAYRGPYPTRLEAWTWIERHGVRIDPADWARRQLPGLEAPISLPEPAAARVGVSAGQGVRVALWRSTCLLVGVEDHARRELHLIDLRGFGWFAKYRDAPS